MQENNPRKPCIPWKNKLLLYAKALNYSVWPQANKRRVAWESLVHFRACGLRRKWAKQLEEQRFGRTSPSVWWTKAPPRLAGRRALVVTSRVVNASFRGRNESAYCARRLIAVRSGPGKRSACIFCSLKSSTMRSSMAFMLGSQSDIYITLRIFS